VGSGKTTKLLENYISAFELYSKRGEQMKRPLASRGLAGAVEYRNTLACLSHNLVIRIMHKFFVSVALIPRTEHKSVKDSGSGVRKEKMNLCAHVL
jgi:hypothetical protein